METGKNKKKKSFAKELQRKLKKNIGISPLLDGILEELERIENIRDSLYEAYTEKRSMRASGDAKNSEKEKYNYHPELFDEYTNKFGATNLVVNVAIKEYKSYSQRFNDLIKTIHNIIKDVDTGDKKPEQDPLLELLGCGKK